jgi:tetratricopeptide (TPR) repeat protein
LNILDNYYHTSEGEAGTGKRIFRFTLKLLLLLVFIAILTLTVWNFTAPESLAKFHGRFLAKPLEIYDLELFYGQQKLNLQPGTEKEINPSLPLKFGRLSTNRWRNYDLRLYSPDFDIEFVFNQTNSLLDLLGEDFFQEPRVLAIEVREGTGTRAQFNLKAAFTALDWSSRGDSAIEVDRKIGYYRRALSLEPDSEELIEKLSEALLSAGKNEELAEFWESELIKVEGASESSEILLRLLGLYQELKDRGKEIYTTERIVLWLEQTGQSTADYKTNLAALYRSEEPLKAAELYEELLSGSQPDHKRAFLGELVSIYRQNGALELEISAWERLLELADPQEVPGIWTELISLKEKNFDSSGQREAWEGLAESLPDGPLKGNAFKRLAYFWYEEEDFSKAYEAYLQAAKYDPTDPSLFLNLARLALKNDNRQGYRENLEKALALEDTPALKRELALAYGQDGFTDKALPLWLVLAELQSQDPEIIKIGTEARAQVLNLLRPTGDKFSDEFETRLYQFSDNSVEFYNLGVAYFKVQNWDKAQKAFLKALELDKEQNSLSVDIRGYLVAIYKEKGQIEDMLNQASLIYRDDPSRKDCRDLVVGEHETAKNWEGLVSAAGDWTKWHPGDVDNWKFLALAQKNAGNDAESAKSLFKVAELESNVTASWLSAAKALEKSGNKAQARLAYEKIMELEPNNGEAEASLLRLAIDGVNQSREKK